MHIGRRIRMLRKGMDLSQSYLGREIISESHLSNIEKGRYIPREDILHLLSKKLHVPTEYLLNYKSINDQLETELEYFNKLIETNLKAAEKHYEEIKKSHVYIPSIQQELYFYLLSIYMFYKLDFGKAEELYYRLDNFITEEDLENTPNKIKRIYINVLALNYFYRKEYLISNQYFHRLLDMLSLSKKIKRANIQHNIALNYWRLKDLVNAEVFCKYSLDIYYKEHAWDSIGEVYNFLGIIYSEKYENKKAIEQLKKIFQIPIDDLEITGKTYHNLGTIYLKYNDYMKAIYYLNKAVEIKKKSPNKKSYVNSIIVLIKVYLKIENLLEVERLFSQVNRQKLNDIDHYRILSLKAKLFFLRGLTHEYEELMIESISFFKQEKMFDYIINLSQELAEYYESINKYKRASIYYKNSIHIYKKIYSG
ncbi:helix-turn-helix domain-containing protein [Bacillus solimangrovi]|uniref:HTH cro/C1-type domain-containing protein n=1 Tax=Bacillus solimangrovi TaxID=1305675 RepID=A0A1E5LJK2_9BACI|nr:helix-turn-helix transcriptional regulator [Bacillus solimangrovi]OEH94267.1 hypothetical protein BFG57_08395 [Bacillus solimangrovi]